MVQSGLKFIWIYSPEENHVRCIFIPMAIESSNFQIIKRHYYSDTWHRIGTQSKKTPYKELS